MTGLRLGQFQTHLNTVKHRKRCTFGTCKPKIGLNQIQLCGIQLQGKRSNNSVAGKWNSAKKLGLLFMMTLD